MAASSSWDIPPWWETAPAPASEPEPPAPERFNVWHQTSSEPALWCGNQLDVAPPLTKAKQRANRKAKFLQSLEDGTRSFGSEHSQQAVDVAEEKYKKMRGRRKPLSTLNSKLLSTPWPLSISDAGPSFRAMAIMIGVHYDDVTVDIKASEFSPTG